MRVGAEKVEVKGWKAEIVMLRGHFIGEMENIFSESDNELSCCYAT